jgi:transcriptional regulator with XRE-family HTH domain
MKTTSTENQFSSSLFINLLKQELRFRKKKNPRYSLRAFARCLEVDQSSLSKILTGRRRPSTQLIAKANLRLKMDLAQAEKDNAELDQHYQQITDTFHLISEWYYFALLELIRTEGFKTDPKWISQRLGISEQEVELASNRLCRLGYIEKRKNRWLLLSPSLTWTNNVNSTKAREMLQQQITAMSYNAIEKIPFESRDHSSLTVAIHPDLIPELRKKITVFRRSLDKFITEHPSKPEEVYQFAFSFFPVSRPQGAQK